MPVGADETAGVHRTDQEADPGTGPEASAADATVTRDALVAALAGRITPERQQRLAAAKVGIAGLGGLGSNIAVNLARTGIGQLHLVDFDVVDITNLNRQQYVVADLGRLKTEALRDYLARINPYCEVTIDTLRLDERNAAAVFDGCDVVCEAFDVADGKAMLVDTLLTQRPGLDVVGASGMAGYDSANTIRTRRVTEHWYLCGDGVSDSGRGEPLMAPRVSTCAGHQSMVVVRLLLGDREP